MEKEFGNCKIDKRILDRELKDAQAEIKQLKEKVETFNDTLAETKKAHESALLELSHINESISIELIKVKDSYRNMQVSTFVISYFSTLYTFSFRTS